MAPCDLRPHLPVAPQSSILPRLFPWWHALLVKPGREQKAADWLKDRVRIEVYWPHYTCQIGRCRSGQRRRPRRKSVIPGMIFAPQEMLRMHEKKLEKLFDLVHVYGYMPAGDGAPARLTKTNIEEVRVMEARLNQQVPNMHGRPFAVGDTVRFLDDLFTDWGNGTIFEVASEARIGVLVPSLFGRRTKVFVPASEIEAM